MLNPENVKVTVNGVECVPFITDESVVIPAQDAVIYPIVIPITMKLINIGDVFHGDGLLDGFTITRIGQSYQYKKRYPKGILYSRKNRIDGDFLDLVSAMNKANQPPLLPQ